MMKLAHSSSASLLTDFSSFLLILGLVKLLNIFSTNSFIFQLKKELLVQRLTRCNRLSQAGISKAQGNIAGSPPLGMGELNNYKDVISS